MITGLLILILLFAAAVLYCYFRCFYHPIPRPAKAYEMPEGQQYNAGKAYTIELMKAFQALDFEPVEIKSHDGLKLYARYYHQADDAPLQILCHGYKGTVFRDFCGGSKLARQAGHNILAIDQRAHGESGGRTISFGINERLDLMAWLRYAVKRFGGEKAIIISGVSMGAATVLMASELELPENVKGIVADCPYSSPYEIIRKVCTDMKLPAGLAMPFIRLSARLIGGFELCSCSAAEAVKKARIPILLIHGEADRFVPCDMSREIAKNSPLIRFETFPEAGHGLSFIKDEARYTKLCDEFFADILK